MAKVPVQRTVIRDGKPHLQTYWEESDPKKPSKRGVDLGKLGVSLPGQVGSVNHRDPVREAWNSSTIVSREAVKRRDPDVEASIAAGLTPEASLYLTSRFVPNGESLADYIYDNGLDHQPRPRDGWKSYGGSDDQRKAWVDASGKFGFTLDQAVDWIDAGFTYPCVGLPEVIALGVDPKRAAEWEDFSQLTVGGSSKGAYLYNYRDELASTISFEEAQEWRVAINRQGSKAPLTSNDLKYYDLGFTAEEAARWSRIAYHSTRPEGVAELKALGWSPSSIKSALKEADRYGGNSKPSLLTQQFAEQMIKATPLIGSPKVVKEWIGIAYRSFDREMDDHLVVKSIRDAEEWKAHAKKVTGVTIKPDDYLKMVGLLPRQRDAYLEIMNTEDREPDTNQYKVSRAMDLAKVIGSSENYRFLKERGFPLGSVGDNVVSAHGHPTGGYDVFDAESASPEDQNRWLRSAATTMYWKNYSQTPVTPDDMRKVINNPDIDPIKLKDTLVSYRGAINPVQLEGILTADVSTAVADGWL